jgi:hypothetical protein
LTIHRCHFDNEAVRSLWMLHFEPISDPVDGRMTAACCIRQPARNIVEGVLRKLRIRGSRLNIVSQNSTGFRVAPTKMVDHDIAFLLIRNGRKSVAKYQDLNDRFLGIRAVFVQAEANVKASFIIWK